MSDTMRSFETKFGCGETVWGVSYQEHIQIIRCETCDSTGKYTIKDTEYICPACEGRSSRRNYAGRKYFIREFAATVGKIQVELQTMGFDATGIQKNSYMIDSTGVGSGTVWSEDRLFGSKQEAQEFCDRMNGALPADEEVGEPIPESRW
jgi:hypothetical protein